MSHARLSRLAIVLVTTVAIPSASWGQIFDPLSGRQLGTLSSSAPPGATSVERIVSVEARLLPTNDNRRLWLAVTATIDPPWYTYPTYQQQIVSLPTVISVDESGDFRLDGEFRPNLPPTIHKDAGETFEAFESMVTWQAPIEIRAGVNPRDLTVTGKIRLQVCTTGSCLPPTEFPFTARASEDERGNGGLRSSGAYHAPAAQATIHGHLEPRVAAPGLTARLVLTATLQPGSHIFELADRDSTTLNYKPTLIGLSNTAGLRIQPTTSSRSPITVKSEIPGQLPQRYYPEDVTWTTVIEIPLDARPGEFPFEGIIGFQTCNDVRCDLPSAARFEGVLAIGPSEMPGATPLAFSPAPYGHAAELAQVRAASQSVTPGPETGYTSLAMVILASLAGGFILNFMPCVLPVIGLKILSFAEQGGKSRAHVLGLNIWYSLGTLSVFWALATLATVLNRGWGQQFQSTSFNVTMSGVVFVMALSFLGVWEIPIPGFVGSGAASEVARREGAAGAFVKGSLTTILATPCSGPLLGGVFGYTLGQPPQVIYLIFTCIGLGMCAPYLVIGAFPSLIRFLPKPGAWMETFKQVMGFVMLFTLVFLFSIIKHDYLVATFAWLIGLWAACWWIGRTPLFESLGRKLLAWGEGAAFATLVGWLAFTWLVPQASIIPWQSFSNAQLQRANEAGNTVLVDFTANWCLSCKWNLKWVIETPDVLRAIERNNVVPLLADYTDESPEIKQTLNSLNSDSIPVLAIFPADRSKPPIILRDLLTKSELLKAIEQAGPSQSTAEGITRVGIRE